MVRNPLLEPIDDELERGIHINVIRPDRVDVLPAAQARYLEHAVDILKCEIDLALDVVGVERPGGVPTTLPGAFDDVAEDDDLRVVELVAVQLAGAFLV